MDKELLIDKIMREIYDYGEKELYRRVERAHLHIFFVVEEKMMDAVQLEALLNELTSPEYGFLEKEETGFKFTTKGREYIEKHFKPTGKPPGFIWKKAITEYDNEPFKSLNEMPPSLSRDEPPSSYCSSNNSAYNSINIEHADHSTIQSGGQGAVMNQTVSYSENDWKNLEEYAQLIIKYIDKLELDAVSKEKALSYAKALESTAKSRDGEKLNLGRQLLHEAHVIAQHALGHAAAIKAIEVAPGLLDWVKTFLS